MVENSQDISEIQKDVVAPLDLRSLFVAGVHFGHPTKRWNPKMDKYIYGKRSSAHIIDLIQTIDSIKDAKSFIEKIVGEGGECLMVGTKPQAQEIIKSYAEKSGAMYINRRWLGGMMTNFNTIQHRIDRLVHLEEAFSKGSIIAQTKRETLKLSNELERLKKFFGGIMEMRKVPDVLFVVDITEEVIAVTEAAKLGIPVVAMVDTNCDPALIKYPIPSNDDSIRSIELITKHISEAVLSGKEIAKKAFEDKLASEAILEAQEAEARSKAQAKAAQKSSGSNSKNTQDKSDSKLEEKKLLSNKANTKPSSDEGNLSKLKETDKVKSEVSAKAKEPKAKEPKAKEAKAKEPKAKEAKAKEAKAKEPKAKEPKAKEPKAKEPKSSKNKKTEIQSSKEDENND